MGLINRLLALLTGGTGRWEDLIAILKARLDSPEGTLGLQGRPKAGFDRLMDALNRLPRPFMALGTLALIAAAMIDPVWFAARMTALAQIPEPLWWLIGAVVSLFFGARFQTVGQQFTREIVDALVPATPAVTPTTPRVAATGADARLTQAVETPGGNPALTDWQQTLT
jgi:hypothetical protein